MPRRQKNADAPIAPSLLSGLPEPVAPTVPVETDEQEPLQDELPLFPECNEAAAISIWRVQPADGYLGQIDPASQEEDIRARWGGGVFDLKLRDAMGRVKRGGTRRLRIAGEPHSLAPEVPAQSVPPREDLREDYVRLVKAEADSALTRREKETELLLARQSAESTQTLARQEAMWKQQLEQQRQMHEQQLERDRQRQDAEAARAREHQASMLQLQQQQTTLVVEAMRAQRSDGMSPKEILELVRTGMELAGDRNSEDPAVAMTKAVSDGIGHMVKLADPDDPRPPRRLEREPARAIDRPRRAPPAAMAAPQDAIARKVGLVAAKLSEKGLDPEKVLDALLEGELALVPTSEVEGVDEDEDMEDNAPHGRSESAGTQPGGAAPPPMVSGRRDHGAPHDQVTGSAAAPRGPGT